jgi:hypothetical protein
VRGLNIKNTKIRGTFIRTGFCFYDRRQDSDRLGNNFTSVPRGPRGLRTSLITGYSISHHPLLLCFTIYPTCFEATGPSSGSDHQYMYQLAKHQTGDDVITNFTHNNLLN